MRNSTGIGWISEKLFFSAWICDRNRFQQLETQVQFHDKTAMYHPICEHSSNCASAHTLLQTGSFGTMEAHTVHYHVAMISEDWSLSYAFLLPVLKSLLGLW